VAELLLPTVDRLREAPALVDERGSETWAELNERVNRLVGALRDAGLAPGDAFAVMCANQREFFEAVLAALHGGWVVVPVNWHWVADELAYVLEDAAPKALLVDQRWVPVAVEAVARAGGPATAVVVGSEAPPDGFVSYDAFLGAAGPGEPPGQAGGGPMFYTSGTTGFPKGVRSGLTATGAPPSTVGALAAGFRALLGLPDDGVALLCGPAYHSAQFVFSVFPLLGGQTVVLQHRFDPAELLELVDAHRVTNLHLVPTQFVRLLKLPDEVRERFDGSSLRVVFHGAAPCPVEVKRRMIRWWGPVISEYYGGTEGGFITMISAEEWLARPGSVGHPTPVTEVLIVGADGRRRGPNETGQIYFRSLLGTDFEYHNAPEKTAAAHLEPGVGTLGDVGYLDDDGYLFMSDRKIDMIISGGVNIYPAEIEGVLIEHPAVSDAAVFGVPDDEMGEQVRAAVQLVEGTEASDALVAGLVAHCRSHLAGYKVPRSIDVHRQLPRNAAGKLTKRVLRDPFWEGLGRSI